jgi:hypothetical protein
MEPNFTIEALRALGHTVFTIVNDDITVEDNGVMRELTEDEKTALDAEIIVQTDAYNALEYSRLRKAEYDKLNQDEMRFDDEINGTTIWVDTILEIKAQFPKP